MFSLSFAFALMVPELTVNIFPSSVSLNSIPAVVPVAPTNDVERLTASERSTSVTVRFPEVERSPSVSSRAILIAADPFQPDDPFNNPDVPFKAKKLMLSSL